MYNVYFAGDLFDHKHIAGNFLLAQDIEKYSNNLYKCLLPQDLKDASKMSLLQIRNYNLVSIIQADLVLFNFDGMDLDSGTAIEFIIAKMLDIPSVLLRTDFRNGGHTGSDWNLMASYYPRCIELKYPVLDAYVSLGLTETYRKLTKAILSSFNEVLQKPPLLNTDNEIIRAHQQVITLCGSGLEQLITPAILQDLIAKKISKKIYSTSLVESIASALQD